MKAKIAIVMGSQSDWSIMKEASELLKAFDVAYETEIVSAHRTPDRLAEYAKTAKSRSLQVIIAGAGGAAHLPGMIAAHTEIPVLGVPIPTKSLNGIDSLLSIVQMPKGIPVGTLAIGTAGAINASLFAIAILALQDEQLAKQLTAYRKQQTEQVLENSIPQE